MFTLWLLWCAGFVASGAGQTDFIEFARQFIAEFSQVKTDVDNLRPLLEPKNLTQFLDVSGMKNVPHVGDSGYSFEVGKHCPNHLNHGNNPFCVPPLSSNKKYSLNLALEHLAKKYVSKIHDPGNAATKNEIEIELTAGCEVADPIVPQTEDPNPEQIEKFTVQVAYMEWFKFLGRSTYTGCGSVLSRHELDTVAKRIDVLRQYMELRQLEYLAETYLPVKDRVSTGSSDSIEFGERPIEGGSLGQTVCGPAVTPTTFKHFAVGQAYMEYLLPKLPDYDSCEHQIFTDFMNSKEERVVALRQYMNKRPQLMVSEMPDLPQLNLPDLCTDMRRSSTDRFRQAQEDQFLAESDILFYKNSLSALCRRSRLGDHKYLDKNCPDRGLFKELEQLAAKMVSSVVRVKGLEGGGKLLFQYKFFDSCMPGISSGLIFFLVYLGGIFFLGRFLLF